MEERGGQGGLVLSERLVEFTTRKDKMVASMVV